MVFKGRRTTRRKKKTQAFPGPNQCHPRIGKRSANDSCLPRHVLDDVGRALGLGERASVKGIASKLGVDPTKKRSFLMRLPLPDAEKAELATKWLRPAMPEGWESDPDMWLNSDDIRKVMIQYEEAFPHFKFLGPFPIDFAAEDPSAAGGGGPAKGKPTCLNTEMCELDIHKEATKDKTMIGIIYNTDPHYKGGAHWIANFINIPKKQCYYFDSYGMKPPKQIYKFMQWLGIQEPKIQLGWNGRRFQYSNTECGMYCMYFLDRMISGESFLHFCRRSPPDSFMLDMRDWMFST